MNEKYLKLTKQFEGAISRICQSPDEYNRFLTTAAFNYRLRFNNAVLAYAQGIGTDLLLTYDQWQLYGRVPRKHSKATLLFNNAVTGRYTVTFASSKTTVDKRIHRFKELRFFDYKNTAEVISALQSMYDTNNDSLKDILQARVFQHFENIFDDAYPAFENETDFLAKSVTNMLMARFGEDMPYDNILSPYGINQDNIEHIYQMVIDVFRAEYAELATSLPIELENVREFTEDDDLPFDDVPVSTDSVAEIKQDVISLFKEKTNGLFHSIDGLSPSEIEQMVKEYAESVFSENDIYAEILGIAISGSRCRGLEHNGSDLDVVIEVQSDTKETALFNLLNERTFEIGGVRVDINPIKADETGTLSEYLPTVEKYLGKIEILDYGKYIIDNRSVFNAKKGSIYTIPIETTPALLRRLEKVGVVPRDEMTDVVFESDNGTWNKLIIPDRYGNKTNSIDISDVLSQEEISVAKKVVADVIEREQSRNETHRSLTKEDVQLLHTIEPRKSVLSFSQDELALTSVWSERFAVDMGKKSPFYRAENGEWRDGESTVVPIISVSDKNATAKTVSRDIKAQVIPRGTIVNSDTGWKIAISRRGLEDTLSHARKHHDEALYSLIYASNDIVQQAVLFDTVISEKNNKNKAYNTAFMHKLYTVCRIGDQPVLAKLSVEEFLDGKGSTLKRMYNLQDIKTEPLRLAAFTDNQLALSVLNGSEISVADLFRIVKTLDKDFYLNKQPHEPAKVFQVITNAGDDGGFDEKPEYATLDEAIQAGNQYIAEGYIGFSIINTETKHIEYTNGDFDVTKAFSDKVLRINNLPVSPVVPVVSFNGENAELTVFDEKSKEGKYSFFGVSEVVNRILATTTRLHASLEEIGAFYNAVTDKAKREEYIRSVFNSDATEFSLSDGTHVGYKAFENGLLIWKGSYDSREGQSFLHWDDVAGHFEAMRMLEMLPSTATASNPNGQLLLFPEITKKQNEKFSFPQEVIDRVLTLRGGERKLRIYEQFQKGLSSKELIAFLKNEYGWGGCSEIIQYTGIAEEHNSKGITLSIGYKENSPRQTLKWNMVVNRIKELIKSDKFLTYFEKHDYPSWLEKQERRRAEQEKRNAELRAERELTDAVYQPSQLIDSLLSGEKTPVAPQPNYSPVMQEYFNIKNANPDKIILFQIGSFYEAMGNDAKIVSAVLGLNLAKRRLTNDESIEMCGFPVFKSDPNVDMLLDRGLNIGISSVNSDGKRFFINMPSQRVDDPVESYPIARLDYYDSNNDDKRIETSFEYLDAEQLKRSILEDINRPSPMGLVVYADENGKTIDYSFVEDLPKPLVSVEVQPLPPIQSEHDILVNRAQELIGEYMNAEFGSDDKPYELPDDLSSVSLAYTTTEDELHEITADANLIDFRIETKIDEKVVRVEQYDSLQDMVENGLDGLRFDDLVYVSDEELMPFYSSDNTVDTESLSGEPTEEESPVPAEKPVVQLTQQDIDSLIILKPSVQNGKAEIYHAIQEEKTDIELIRLIRDIYRGGGRNVRSESGLLLQISDNSKGIFIAAYDNTYQPIVITYKQLLKRIRELADTNRYLTDSEFNDYAANHHLGDKAAALRQVSFKYEIGSAVYINGEPYMITAMSPISVAVSQPDAPLFGHTYSLEDFEALLLQNVDDNLSLVVKPETRYEIYQIADTEQAHRYIFLSLKSLEESGLAVERNNYELVYSGTLGEGETLDTLYERFNVDHPDDFFGHSMSVSDVIVLTKNGESKAYFCDDVGFPEVPRFLYHEESEDAVLDTAEEVESPKAPDYSDLIDKTVEYADKTFRVKSVNQFGQAHMEDISSLSDGVIPIDTVLPVETVRELIEAQAEKNPENFVITDNQIGEGTPSERFNNNIAAIKVVQQLQAEERPANKAEQAILSRYVGWGGLPQYFEKSNSHYDELKNLLSDSDYQSAQDSALTSFYTPPAVAKSIYQALTNMSFTNGRILDPACGTGHFFGTLPEHLARSELFGVELDDISGQIAKALYPNANIRVQGFEDANIPNNSIDVAVGNVPFGEYRVFDKGYNQHHLLIHDYFFVKTLDKIRPGGIVAFVTSMGTLDKQDTKARRLLADKADLLGAIRLPNDTFKSAAGTKVTSDIIFLQKRESAEIVKEYPDWVYTSENSDGIRLNNYFVAHPEMICGKMVMQAGRFGEKSACVPFEDTKLVDVLSSAIQNIQGEYIPYTAANEESAEPESVAADEAARNYSYFVKDDTLYYRENGIMFVSAYEGKKAERIKGMVKITDITRRLIDAELSGEAESVVTELRRDLNAEYDSFSAQFGSLNSFANKVFKNDSSYPLLCSLEKVTTNEETDEQSISKADIFEKRTIAPRTEIKSAENAEEALIISVSQKGRVDLDYMSRLTGSATDQLISELNGSSIFLKPYEGEYVTADEYLSGNVRKKLTTARMAANDDKGYEVNVAALEAVIPKDIPASEITVRLGTTWIPVHYYNQFLQETFHPQSDSIEIQYNEIMNSYYITGKTIDNYSVESVNQYGIKERNGYVILEDCLNLKTSEVRDPIEMNGNTRYVVNKEKTILAQSRQELLKAKFDEWIYKDPSRRRDLERIYNDRFNCIVPRQYDGSHLTFPGKNPNITFRPHQLNAIARGLYGGNTLLAHCVGAGKSFEMIAIAMKLKELGLVHKSLICVPKHLVAQMGAEFMRLYPSANILVAEEKDFVPQNRKRFCTRIATGDYDAIVIGHTQLEKIPLKPETQAEVFDKQLNEILAAIEEANSDGTAETTIKSLTRSKKAIESKLKELNEKSLKKDNVIYFEELGVDQIFVDEAHLFKNLYLYTKMRNVSGIGAGSESGRAADLYSKVCYLNQLSPGKGVVFATGTPISNTISEIYTMQRYLQPQMLKAMGLMNFDNWATTFGETVTALEISPDGNGYQIKIRFSKFNNVPELIAMFKQVADVQTRDTIRLPVPAVKRKIVEVLPTEEQKEMIEGLGERAEIVRARGVDPSVDNILKIISDGKAIALDPRILDSENNSGMKTAACAEDVFTFWSQSKDRTQLVFCDLSTPSAGKSNDKPFTVYNDLKRKMVSLGIPEDEIQFIQHFKSSKAKQKLFSEVRRGKVRVLIGSTEMMGTGMNVQHKLIALHHLDCPNRPSDIEQREGRIIRQGNTNDTVYTRNYVTKGTFDAFMYQMVERKQRFISSFMTAKSVSERSVEDIDEAALNFGQIKAVASGNPLVMKKFEIDNKVNKLAAIRNEFINEHRRMEDEVQLLLPKTIQKLETMSAHYKEDIDFAKANPEPEPFDIEIGGVHYDKRTKALEAIVAQRKNIKENELLKIGSYRGFTLYLYQEGAGYLTNLCMTIKHQLGYRLKIEPENGAGNLVRLDNIISFRIMDYYDDTVKDLTKAKHRMATAKEELNREFPQEAEYRSLLEQQAEINAKLTVGEDKSTNGNTENKNNINHSPDDIPQQQAPSNRPRIRR